MKQAMQRADNIFPSSPNLKTLLSQNIYHVHTHLWALFQVFLPKHVTSNEAAAICQITGR